MTLLPWALLAVLFTALLFLLFRRAAVPPVAPPDYPAMPDRRPGTPLAEIVELLDEHVIKMTAEVVALRYEVQLEREQRRNGDGIMALGLLLVGVVVVGMGFVVAGNRQTLDKVNEVVATLTECTVPGNPEADDVDDRVHECYEDGRARTADAVALIVDANIAAAICFRDEVVDIEACVADRLADRPSEPPNG